MSNKKIEFHGDVDTNDNMLYGTIIYGEEQKPAMYTVDLVNRKRIALKHIEVDEVDEEFTKDEIREIKKFIQANILDELFIY